MRYLLLLHQGAERPKLVGSGITGLEAATRCAEVRLKLPDCHFGDQVAIHREGQRLPVKVVD